MPAEWWPHTRCWMAWPTQNEPRRPGLLEDVRKEVAAVARAIAEFEPVWMIATSDSAEEAARLCGDSVTIVPLPIDDSWARDTCPTFLVNEKGECAGVAWIFNGWGQKFRRYPKDLRPALPVLEKLNLPAFTPPLVLEGGNLCVDGEGTLLISKTAILNRNRNLGLQCGEAEDLLRVYLGVDKVIWLPGNPDDTLTDGHVDGIACFYRPGVVIAEIIENKNDSGYKALDKCRQKLTNATDARGRKLDVHTLTRPRERPSRSKDFCSSYLNFYIANGGIIMPKFGDERADEAAHQVVVEAFPDRRVVQLPIDALAEDGGGIHCITQQQPSGQKPA
jgi:agmatine deiminase